MKIFRIFAKDNLLIILKINKNAKRRKWTI